MIKKFIKRRRVSTSYGNFKQVDDVLQNNMEEKNDKDMIIPEQITQAQELVNDMNQDIKVKKVKKDKGLMEKVTSEKVVIVEDNRQILND